VDTTAHGGRAAHQTGRDDIQSGYGTGWRIILPTSIRGSGTIPQRDAIAAPIRSDPEIEAVMAALGREPGGGVVVMPDGGFTFVHRAPIISLAARNNIPAVHPHSVRAREGGLMSYGPDQVDIFRRSASYIDRLLRRAKPAELPVQVPVKFEVINLKTAKALGITVPLTLRAIADEVIE
jgi:putative tryptophan/tyrosine transport system substrate-binding protein